MIDESKLIEARKLQDKISAYWDKTGKTLKRVTMKRKSFDRLRRELDSLDRRDIVTDKYGALIITIWGKTYITCEDK